MSNDTPEAFIQILEESQVGGAVDTTNDKTINLWVEAEAYVTPVSGTNYIDLGVQRGNKGDSGQSAYQSAVSLGYAGTEAEWLTSLQGIRGLDGKSVRIIDNVPTSADLPTSGQIAGDGYLADDTGNLWVWGTSWTDVGHIRGPEGLPGPTSTVPGPGGPSAYQVAVSTGFVGTETEWITSLRGSPGSDADATVLVGNLANLVTTAKSNVVAAINEVSAATPVIDGSTIKYIGPDTPDTSTWAVNDLWFDTSTE